MAAGPGIPPRARGSNFRSGRSENNYPHLVARRLGLDLVDVTSAAATTAHLLTDRQHGAPPQVEALDGTEGLVTITIGGNDVGYVPLLVAGGLPALLRVRAGDLLDRDRRTTALAQLPARMTSVLRAVRERSPGARVVVVDYLSLLPPQGPAGRLSSEHTELGRYVGQRLTAVTTEVAAAEGCELVAASRASRDHHPWAAIPWCNGAGLPVPGRPLPFHPNEVGMRAVAGLIATHVSG